MIRQLRRVDVERLRLTRLLESPLTDNGPEGLSRWLASKVIQHSDKMCANPACHTLFEPSRNRRFCDACRAQGITCEAPDTAGTGTAAGALVVRLSRLRARLPRRSHHWSRWAGSVHRQGILGEGAKTPGRPRRSEPSRAWSTASAAIRNCVLSDRGGGWSTRLAPVGARDARLAKSSRAGRRQPGRTAAPPVRTARWSSAHPSGQGVAGLSSRPHRGRLGQGVRPSEIVEAEAVDAGSSASVESACPR